MITNFFQPKSSKKVTPAPSSTSDGSSSSVPKKRALDNNGAGTQSSNKKSKQSQQQDNDSSAVEELLSYLNSPEKSDDETVVTWTEVLSKHFSTPAFERLAKFVRAQRKSHKVYPPVQDTFSALNWTPLDQVKVVIVGQDPYHGPNQAHGLCFSVRKGIRTPPSLRNIYKELKQDSAMDNFSSIPDHGYLERWAKQGVLMINTVMTVRQGEANSHKKKGWELVTDEIIRAVDRRAKQNRQQQQDGEGGAAGGGVVFLLWGKPATEKCQTALGVSLYNKNNDSSGVQSHRNIICTSHPSPLGATKTKSPFMGSHCFSRCNEALEAMGHTPIDWRVDGKL